MTVEKSTKRFFRHVSRIIKLYECKQQFKAYLSKPRKYTKKWVIIRNNLVLWCEYIFLGKSYWIWGFFYLVCHKYGHKVLYCNHLLSLTYPIYSYSNKYTSPSLQLNNVKCFD